MSSEHAQPHPCKQCGYELNGLPSDAKGRVRCPECGQAFSFWFARHPMDKAQFHRLLLLQVLLPTALPTLIVYLFSISYNPALGLACIVFPAMPIVMYFVFDNAYRTLTDALADPPRPVPPSMKIPWIMVYMTPGFICYALLIFTAPW